MAEAAQQVKGKRRTVARRSFSLHWVHLIPPMLVVLVVATVVALLGAFEVSYLNRIYPGVGVWGVDLGGLSYAQAVALVEKSFPYAGQPALILRDGDQTWQVRPVEVGTQLDARALVDRAYSLGRSGGLIERLKLQADLWRFGRQLSPVVVFDPAAARAYVENLAATLNRPAQDAGLRLDGMRIVTTQAVVGRRLEVEPVVTEMREAIRNLQPVEIELPFRAVQPTIADVGLPARELEKLLGSPLTLVELLPTGVVTNSWTIAPEALAGMVVLRREGDQILVKLDENQLRAVLEPIAPSVAQPALDGRYVFDDDTAQFIVVSHSLDGRELDIPATLDQVNQQAFTDNRRVPLVFRAIKAKYHDGMTPQELGITELIATGVTYFKGSSLARVHNIGVAASKFHGIIIAPGETFSFNEYLGDVSLEEGYETGLIIYEGRTIEGVGGGVCQVSTTAFRAAFQAGFPIVERWPHAYRVSWYERGFGPGLDATVFAPLVDFKFTNDTPYHLLIETYVNRAGGTLTYKFYSTSDGRKITISPPEVINVVEHGPDIYEEDPSLLPGAIEQVDWAVDGADVTVRRTVERGGEVLHQDAIFTRYLPWQAVFKVGPETAPE